MQSKKLLLFANSCKHFYQHLLPIALSAKNSGYNVTLLTNSDVVYNKKIEDFGIGVITLSLSRKSINPVREILTLAQVISVLRKEQPDILHNFTIKPIVYGSIASWLYNKKIKLINNFLGMGFVFISTNSFYQLLRKLIYFVLAQTVKNHQADIIVQNADDKELLVTYAGIDKRSVFVQCSVGLETAHFPKLEEPQGKIVFALVARMLKDKGIYEFIQAARILKEQNVAAECWLVGDIDEGNHSSITLTELQQVVQKGIVKYLGYQENIGDIWQKAHVAVLPSYREGLSRSLLEAGAYGRAIITTDAPGGRELITDKLNGLLVLPKDVTSLVTAMKLLADSAKLRQELGHNIREHIITHYDNKIIVSQMLDFYTR